MRVLLSTIGSRGDVQPLVALAVELKALGQEVRLCIPPDFREWIESLGIPVVPIGPEVRSFAAARGRAAAPPSPEHVRQLVEDSVATQFETIGEAARDCDVVVAATALQVAARSIAELRGIPYVFAAYAPIVLPSPHHESPQDAARFNATFGAALNAQRASRNLPPVDDVQRHMFTERPWLAADPTLAPWPDPADEGIVQTGAWILPDPRPLPADLETFLESGEPPVYIGFGSTGMAEDLTQAIVESARALGRRAIVSRGWADLSLVDNEPDCLALGEVNMQALFTRVAAVVHHGGAGTTTAAALAGAPQVVVPQVYDQRYWAQRIHDLGVGTGHAPGAPTTASLTRALERTLQRDVAARAQSIATAVRRDGAHAAAQRVISRAL